MSRTPLPPSLGPSAVYCSPQNLQDPSVLAFLDACQSNNTRLALQLAAGSDSGSLTYGLNETLRNDYLELARQLLAFGAMWDGETLHVAARSLDVFKLLQSFGLDVNSPTPEGGVLLNFAVQENNEPYVRYLLSQGANPNLGQPANVNSITTRPVRPVENSGSNLNITATYGTPEIFSLLLSYGAVLSNAFPLHHAVVLGPGHPPGCRIPMLKYLLSLGLDINAMDDGISFGWGIIGTPLHHAITWVRIQEAKWLIENGADPDKKAPTPWATSPRENAIQRRLFKKDLDYLFGNSDLAT